MKPAVPALCLVLVSGACSVPTSSIAGGSSIAIGTGPGGRTWTAPGFAEAMARLRAGQPGGSPQEPLEAASRHIDQREPPRISNGPRRFLGAPTPVALGVRGGVGTVHVAAPGSQLDDTTQAAFVQVHLDGAVQSPRGASLHVQAFGSEDDLFAGRQINDGVAPARADAEVRGVDVFPHLRYDLAMPDSLTLPVRIGLFADRIDVDHASGVDRTWISVGPRVVFEPAWRCFGDAERGLELVGRLGGEAGATWFREEFRGGDDSDHTMRWAGQVGAGLRGTLGAMQIDFGYQLDAIWFGSTSTELYGRRGGTDVLRQGLMLGGTIAF